MWNLKKMVQMILFTKKEIESQIKKKKKTYGYQRGKGRRDKLSIYVYIDIYTGEGNDTPLQYSSLENPMDRGAWQAAIHGVTKSRT